MAQVLEHIFSGFADKGFSLAVKGLVIKRLSHVVDQECRDVEHPVTADEYRRFPIPYKVAPSRCSLAEAPVREAAAIALTFDYIF